MLKRIFTYFVLAVTMLQSSGAYATDLQRAFGSVVGGEGMATVSGPGVYNSATRNVFVAGGIEARFPRASSVSLLSISPPTMPTAGCGGISAHFGGFSFISGDQIEKLIKNIGQNAVGMVVSVVIKTLCPICDAVIQAMTKLAQDAAKLSIDSCAVASNIVNTVAASASINIPDEKYTGVCSKQVSVKGKTSDYLSAVQGISSACASVSDALTEVGNAFRAAEGNNPDGTPKQASNEDKETVAKVKYDNAMGNTTWNLLNAVYGPIKNLDTLAAQDDFRNRMLLMNVLGTQIITDKDTKSTLFVPSRGENATLSPKQLFELFMCGAPGSYTNGKTAPDSWIKTRQTAAYCEYFYGSAPDPAPGKTKEDGYMDGGYDWWVMECPLMDLEGKNNVLDCLHVTKVRLRDSQLLKGQGFLPQTEKILADAVEAVRTNANEGFSIQFLNLAKAVNFPIYQAVNAAAVYPASTNDLLSTLSVLTAESLVYSKLEEVVRPQGKNPNRYQINPEQVQRLYKVLEEMNKQHLSQREAYGRMMTLQEGAAHSIRQVNLAIQKQVLTPELLGNQKFGNQVTSSMTDSAK